MKPSRASVSFWAVDSFLYLVQYKSDVSTEELLSRAASFVESYVLFDQVVLPERYKQEPCISVLNDDTDVFQFYAPSDIRHSSDLKSGVTIDLSFDVAAFSDLSKEDAAWYVQHNGMIDESDYAKLAAEGMRRSGSFIGMAHLRLWQWGLMHEICDEFGAVAMPPMSLVNMERVLTKPNATASFIVEKYRGLESYLSNAHLTVSKYLNPPKAHRLEVCPPLFSLLLNRSSTQESVLDTLKRMRAEFKELRDFQASFLSALTASGDAIEQANVVEDWNASWEKLLKTSFRKPQFLRRTMTSAEVGKAIENASTLRPGLFIEKYLDYRSEMKTYKRFKIFADLKSQLTALGGERRKLELLFGIQDIKPLSLQ